MRNIELIGELSEPYELLDESGRKKPRRKLAPCFACGKHLRGRSVTNLKNVNDSFTRGFHKQCAEAILKEEDSYWQPLPDPPTEGV